MELSRRLSTIKKEWKLFWSALFKPSATRPTARPKRVAKRRSISVLSMRRQRLQRRLEAIKKEAERLESENLKSKDLVSLHDEGQQLAEQIEDISKEMNSARAL